MEKNMKNTLLRRGLTCLIALLLAVTPLASCKPQSNNGNNSNKEVISLITQSLSDYTIVRPDTTTAAVRQAMADLTSALSSSTGCSLPLGTDWVDHGESAPADTLEILVGRTNRQESIDAHASLKENEYTVCMMGKRLVLVGYNDDCTAAAVTAFIKLLPSLVTDSSALALESDFKLLDTYSRYPWLNEFDKSSLSMYLGEKLTCKEETLLYFEPDLG